MKLQEKAENTSALGIYFHIPFCASSCDFCAFYQEAPQRAELSRYITGIEDELKVYTFADIETTVFWGGGTPGLLPASDLYRMGTALLNKLSKPPIEWTVELAPSVVKEDKIKALLDLGVNRISMGVQTFNEKYLRVIGRRHSAKQVYKAIDIIKHCGFENFNLDLIFSIPGQSMDDWLLDINEAKATEPAHISTYCLTFEEDTVLYSKLLKGQTHKKSEDEDAIFYEKTWETLENANFSQYEISNFSKPGKECLHNINTWRMNDWIGLGPSAASQFNGSRFANHASVEKWLTNMHKNNERFEYLNEISSKTFLVDSLIFGLRMNKGVNLKFLRQRFSDISLTPLNNLWQKLIEEKLVILNSVEQLYLTPKGRLLCDSIAVEIMNTFDE